jgi:hypothetical protein
MLSLKPVFLLSFAVNSINRATPHPSKVSGGKVWGRKAGYGEKSRGKKWRKSRAGKCSRRIAGNSI